MWMVIKKEGNGRYGLEKGRYIGETENDIK